MNNLSKKICSRNSVPPRACPRSRHRHISSHIFNVPFLLLPPRDDFHLPLIAACDAPKHRCNPPSPTTRLAKQSHSRQTLTHARTPLLSRASQSQASWVTIPRTVLAAAPAWGGRDNKNHEEINHHPLQLTGPRRLARGKGPSSPLSRRSPRRTPRALHLSTGE